MRLDVTPIPTASPHIKTKPIKGYAIVVIIHFLLSVIGITYFGMINTRHIRGGRGGW